MHSSRLRWQIILFFTMIFWSSYYIVTKALLIDYSPVSVVIYRILFALIALAPFYFFGSKWQPFGSNMGKKKKKMVLNRKDFFLLIVASLSGVLAAYTFLIFGVKYAGAGIASILINTNPFFIVVIAMLLKMEKLSAIKVFGIIMGIFGVALVMLKGQDLSHPFAGIEIIGMVYAMLAALGAAVMTLIGKRCLIPKMGGLNFTFFTFIPSSILLFLFCGITDPSVFIIKSLSAFAGFVYIGVVTTALTYWLFAESLYHLDAGLASSFKLLIPPFSVVLAFLIFGEKLPIQAYIGMVIIMMGIYFVSNEKLSSGKYPK